MLWNSDTEICFFESALAKFAAPEQLFYSIEKSTLHTSLRKSKQKE